MITGNSNANLKPTKHRRKRVFCTTPFMLSDCISSPWKSLQASCTSDIQQPYETFTRNKIWSHSLKGILTEYITEK